MKLMVIDGNSIVNRAFYGVSQNLTTRTGFPTNAIFGFLNILFKLLEEENPDALCVAFDLKGPTFRHLAYEGYKAHRKGMPEELATQMPVLKEVLDVMNIPRYELEGWEADDLIGAITVRDTAAGWDTVVVTGDKDSLQLVTDKVTVKLVSTRMGQTTTKDMTPETFFQTYGFEPKKIVDLKALMGDASDNIPGVTGIGEKTAMALIQRYGSVEELYANFEQAELKPAARRKLDEGRDMAKLSYDLATIRTDAPIDFAPEDAIRKSWNEKALYQKLLELEFSKLIDKLGLHPESASMPPKKDACVGNCTSEMVTDRSRMEELLELWRNKDHVTLLALPELRGVCVEYWLSEHENHAALILADRLDCYNDFLQKLFSADIKKVSHRVKDLMHALLTEGLSTEGFIFDTELAAYLLSPTDGSYELEKLSISYFNFESAKAKDYLAPDAFGSLFTFETAKTEGNDPYAGEKNREKVATVSGPMGALLTHTSLIDCLYRELKKRLEELDMLALLTDLELPLCPVLAEMERIGFLVNRQALADFGSMLTDRIRELEQSIYQLAGKQFNINSTQQLGHILFHDLGLPPVKKTKTGYSTSAEVLEKLRSQHPVVEQVLEYRQLAKLNSTYVEGLAKVIAPDGRIHTSFQNTVTATGRLSSTEPNLQNIPVRTPLGAEMRKMFMAGPGNILVDADYSQIELRLLAHIAGDQAMQDAFNTGADIHTITASQVLGIPVEKVTKAERSSAKAVNFGIVYGISSFSLSQDIHVSVNEAKEYMDRYLSTYAGVARYQKEVVEKAKSEGYVSTLMGRRRWVPELRSSNFNQRSFGERVALNAPIQGTAADLIKLAMVRVDCRLRKEGLKARLVLQVHDELIVECPEKETETVKNILREEMEGVATLAVPLTADAEAGQTWAECH